MIQQTASGQPFVREKRDSRGDDRKGISKGEKTLRKANRMAKNGRIHGPPRREGGKPKPLGLAGSYWYANYTSRKRGGEGLKKGDGMW